MEAATEKEEGPVPPPTPPQQANMVLDDKGKERWWWIMGKLLERPDAVNARPDQLAAFCDQLVMQGFVRKLLF